MKIAACFAAVAALSLSATAAAHEAPTNQPTSKHSGGTDSNGCHKNHSTGEYHCHNPK